MWGGIFADSPSGYDIAAKRCSFSGHSVTACECYLLGRALSPTAQSLSDPDEPARAAVTDIALR